MDIHNIKCDEDAIL